MTQEEHIKNEDRQDVFGKYIDSNIEMKEILENLEKENMKEEEKNFFLQALYQKRKDETGEFSSNAVKDYGKELVEQYRSDPLRFIHEFTQNIDDCEYEQGEDAKLEIKFSEDAIFFSYNEIGFTAKNVFSLCSFGQSTKVGQEDTEGEKGKGFKSVFGVAKKVAILSNGFHFQLSSENFVVPTPLEEKFSANIPEKGTVIILSEFLEPSFLEDVEKLYKSELQLEHKLSNLFLFTRKLKKIHLRCIDGSYHEMKNTSDSILKLEYGVTVESEELAKEKYGEQGTENKEITITFAVDTTAESVGKIYATLPCNLDTALPVSINAPFLLSTNRSDLKENSPWNQFLFQQISENFPDVLGQFSEQIAQKDIIKFFPSRDIEFYGFHPRKLFQETNLFEIHSKEDNKEEYSSLNHGAVFVETFAYDFPEENRLWDLLKTGKTLLSREIDPENKIEPAILTKKGKLSEIIHCWTSYVEPVSEEKIKFLDNIFLNEIEKALKNDTSLTVKIKTLPILHKKNSQTLLSIAESSNGFWYNNLEEENPKKSCGRFQMLSDYNLCVAHENIIALLSCVENWENLEKKFREEIQKVKTKEDLIEFLEVQACYGFTLGDSKIPFLRNYCMPEEDNWFLEIQGCFKDVKTLFQDKEELFVHCKEIIAPFCLNHHNWMELFQGIDLLTKIAPSQEETLCQLKGQLYVMVLGSLLEKKESTQKTVPPNIPQLSLSLGEILHKNLTVTQGKLSEEKEEKEENSYLSLWNLCSKIYKDNFQIADATNFPNYESLAFKSAVEHFFEGKNSLYKKIMIHEVSNPPTENPEQLPYIFYYQDKNPVVLLLGKDSNASLSSYIDHETGRSGSFKSYLDLSLRKESFENQIKEGSFVTKEKFIEELAEIRRTENGLSSFAMKDIIALLNESNPNINLCLELLQNINDARKNISDKESPIKITIEESTLTLTYEERGFNYQDIWAITTLASSTKGEGDTGNKGIGFKTIFHRFDVVTIESGGFHFSLKGDKGNSDKTPPDCYTVPTWIGEIVETPDTVVTTMIFQSKENSTLLGEKSVEEQFKNPLNYLFLANTPKAIVNGQEIVTEEYFSYEIEENDLCCAYYFPKDPIGKKGQLYTTLPVSDVTFDTPIYINAPFELSTGRNSIKDKEKNRELSEFVYGKNGFNEAFEQLADDLGSNQERLSFFPQEDVFSQKNEIAWLDCYQQAEKQSINNCSIFSAPAHYQLMALMEQMEINLDHNIVIMEADDFENFRHIIRNISPMTLATLLGYCGLEEDAKFDEGNALHQFIEKNIWCNPYCDFSSYLSLPVFPYLNQEGVPMLGKIQGNTTPWYYIPEEIDNNAIKRIKSNDSFKILALDKLFVHQQHPLVINKYVNVLNSDAFITLLEALGITTETTEREFMPQEVDAHKFIQEVIWETGNFEKYQEYPIFPYVLQEGETRNTILGKLQDFTWYYLEDETQAKYFSSNQCYKILDYSLLENQVGERFLYSSNCNELPEEVYWSVMREIYNYELHIKEGNKNEF